MLYGGHVKKLEHLEMLQEIGFDFGEVVFRTPEDLALWNESGVKNRFGPRFFLLGHGPFEGPPNDIPHLYEAYLPSLKQSVDVAHKMELSFLTVHLWLDSRFVKPDVRLEKIAALRELIGYGQDRGIEIALENLSESAEDLGPIFDQVPGLVLTLDVGHAQLLSKFNRSFEIIDQLRAWIRHVHVHDNQGGNSAKDDIHLPIGKGIIDFPSIMAKLVRTGYDGTVTLELEPDALVESRARIQGILESVLTAAQD
ncbi:MAG: sugar phosphate isomerase/epimerase family protein [Thermodesulfobacteriota bacterium]